MTLAAQLSRKLTTKRTWLADAALILTGAALIAAAAQVRVYLLNTPVPMTLQTLAVLLIGAALGARRGAAAAALYVAAGSLGLPMFSGLNGGAAALFGPTGGYLIGFIPAAALVGWLAERRLDRRLVSAIPTFLAGQIVIYLCGALWLGQFVGGFSQAVLAGILPFVVGDMLKVAAAILLLPATWRLISRSQN